MDVFTRLENLELPVVALIDGFALGGGNELAISAHYRIATENAQLGQPEVKLGIIPGYGGMQRLPRLIGPRKAGEMSANGESVGGSEALRIGLVDELQPSSTAFARAFEVARSLMSGDIALERADWATLAAAQAADIERLYASSEIVDLLGSASPGAADVGDLRAARRYAARIALEAMRYGYEHGFTAGLENDARLFGAVGACPSGQHWVGRFLAKDPVQMSFLELLPEK